MGVIWENSLAAFLIVTLFVGGGAAFMTGRAIAKNWKPLWLLVIYTLLLTCADRFLHFALYEGTLLTLHFFLVDFLVLMALSALGFRLTRTRQMVTQYRWLYEQVTPLSWRKKPGVDAP